VANISPEYMAQVSAVRAQEEALAAAKQRAQELAKETDRALQARDVESEKRILSELAPDDAERRVLDQVGAADKTAELVLSVTGLQDLEAAKSALDSLNDKTIAMALEATGLPDVEALRQAIDGADDKTIALALEATGAANIEELRARLDAAPDEKTVKMILRATGTEDIEAAKAKLAQLQNRTVDITITSEGVTAEIERLRAIGGEATDAERARLVELIEAEKTLLAIKQRQNEQNEQAAQQAARLADMQASMVLEAEKAVAQAMGDKAAVRAIEIEEKTRQMAKQLETQGMDPNEAMATARNQAELLQLANEINQTPPGQQIAQGDSQRSIGLGGSAGLGPSMDAQREMVKKQNEANRYLADIKSALEKRTPVMLAEVFD